MYRISKLISTSLVNSGKNTPKRFFLDWEPCTWMMERPVDWPSTANIGMLWEFSPGWRLVFLTPYGYRIGHYINIVWMVAQDDIVERLGMTKKECCFLWLWAPAIWFLSNDEAYLTWLKTRNALSVDQKLFTARLVISPDSVRSGDLVWRNLKM